MSALQSRNCRYSTEGNREIQTFQVIFAFVQCCPALSCSSMALFGLKRLTHSSADKENSSKAMLLQATSLSEMAIPEHPP